MMDFLKNRWFRCALVSVLWVLFTVWMRNLWLLFALPLVFDWYITRFFSRYVLKYHRQMREKSAVYKTVSEWVEAIVFAAVAASVIHIFVFQMYVIPTPSMEKTLLVGDYLYVSKLTYGPKMPNTPLSLPLVHNTMPGSTTGAKSYSEAIKLPYNRLRGLQKVERNDVVVFNYPTDTLIARPVDKRENYVKRCVALPGDTICIVASGLYVNGQPQATIPGVQQLYYVTVSAPFSQIALDSMGVSRSDVMYSNATGEYLLPLTAAGLEKARGMKNVLDIERFQSSSRGTEIFPNNSAFGWTENDFGPLWIPAKGATVALTIDNLPLYRRIIAEYEGNELAVDGDTIYINGEAVDSYTFRMDYFWMMGDNRQNSLDSRFWGFVPEDHIVGKASFVWLSLDSERSWLDGKVRWNKMFKKIR